MPKIIQLSPHVANLIAAGEVVERPASVVKELLENAVDAGASMITVEIQNGGMTYLRVTDNGCGMTAEDAKTAFLRHATSKLRNADDLAAISTMGFRGEALAAIASVSRIDLMTKTPGSVAGTSLTLEAGTVTDQSDVGCPDGTTIIIRDLFYNTPARMKFMKSDSVEGGKVASAVQMQALAHPEVSFTFLRDGKQALHTPGDGDLKAAVYCVYGRDSARFVEVSSRWEGYSLRGFVSKPTDARPSRSLQTFFVNNRPVKSKLLISALEEAYRNQIMVGKFPACVLHLTLPAGSVDVNVHPAKTEVKFLSEKAAFDCVHYGVLGALNKTPDRPEVRLEPRKQETAPQKPQLPVKQELTPKVTAPAQMPKKKEDYFLHMNAEEYRNFSAAVSKTPAPDPASAKAAVQAVRSERPAPEPIRNIPLYPKPQSHVEDIIRSAALDRITIQPKVEVPGDTVLIPTDPLPLLREQITPPEEAPEQEAIVMPAEIPWRMVGELYNSYIIVEQGDEAFLIDKHAAHERVLFERLRANPQEIVSQNLLIPVTVRLRPDAAAMILSKAELLDSLGFEAEEFGENTLAVRRAPMDIAEGDIADAITEMADRLLSGRGAALEEVRDELLHTMACKAAIKAGWKNDEKELLAVVKEVMSREELKYCPHGRPICVTLSKKMLEKQFKRT